MTSREEANRLSAAQKRLVKQAQGEIAAFFGTLDLTRPAAVRDALLQIVPLLVNEYGGIASLAAAEWYEQAHPGNYLAQTVPMALDGQVQGAVRYHAASLFGDDPALMLSALQGSVQRFISYGGRATVARNVQLDPLKPRFARVPSGSHTCAWCSLMASRGFVYVTRNTAGLTDKFHDDCDCQIVSSWDKDQTHMEGYDPDQMYDQYLQARSAVEAAGNPLDDTNIATEMRRMFPDVFTDGVHTH